MGRPVERASSLASLLVFWVIRRARLASGVPRAEGARFDQDGKAVLAVWTAVSTS